MGCAFQTLQEARPLRGHGKTERGTWKSRARAPAGIWIFLAQSDWSSDPTHGFDCQAQKVKSATADIFTADHIGFQLENCKFTPSD